MKTFGIAVLLLTTAILTQGTFADQRSGRGAGVMHGKPDHAFGQPGRVQQPQITGKPSGGVSMHFAPAPSFNTHPSRQVIPHRPFVHSKNFFPSGHRLVFYPTYRSYYVYPPAYYNPPLYYNYYYYPSTSTAYENMDYNYDSNVSPTMSFEEMGRNWGQDLRRGVVTWEQFLAYAKETLPRTPQNFVEEFRVGFVQGYGLRGEDAFARALGQLNIGPAATGAVLPAPPATPLGY